VAILNHLFPRSRPCTGVGPQQAGDIFDTTCFIAAFLGSISVFWTMKVKWEMVVPVSANEEAEDGLTG
jgi:hypothetical protein